MTNAGLHAYLAKCMLFQKLSLEYICIYECYIVIEWYIISI